MNNNGCPTHGWSLIASASMDSQLAGVLAGFVFTGIVLLFNRQSHKSTQTLGLFCAAFVALGFDSHLFGTTSGESSDPFCARVWAQEMTAAGLLGVGAMAIITGISWLRASHLDETARSGNPPDLNEGGKVIKLGLLMRIAAYGVGVAVTGLLSITTEDYLYVVHKTASALYSVVFLSPILVLAVSVGIALPGAWLTRRRSSATRDSIANIALQIAAYGMLLYAVGGPIFNAVVNQLGSNVWLRTSETMVTAVIIVGLGIPALLVVALVLAVPPFPSNPQTNHTTSIPASRNKVNSP